MSRSFVLTITDLHHRHDITKVLGDFLCESASVCLNRHHSPPQIMSLVFEGDPYEHACSVIWIPPSAIVQRSHDEEYDTTEEGAYAVVLVAVEAYRGLIAVSRARRGTGADFILKPGPLGAPESYPPDFENAIRLEVSGVNDGPEREVQRRLATKVEQIRSGVSDLPGLAGVVGFRACIIALESVEIKT